PPARPPSSSAPAAATDSPDTTDPTQALDVGGATGTERRINASLLQDLVDAALPAGPGGPELLDDVRVEADGGRDLRHRRLGPAALNLGLREPLLPVGRAQIGGVVLEDNVLRVLRSGDRRTSARV